MADISHRRYNPLLRQWILVSPGRDRRPWGGHVASMDAPPPAYDPECYLCPGNARAGGVRNPQYTGTFVFDNDFPALQPLHATEAAGAQTGPRQPPPLEASLLLAEPASGRCRVICYDPRHDRTLATLESGAVLGVVQRWREEFVELGRDPHIDYVTVFENRGAMMGASNPHPHGQIWATAHVPSIPATEQIALTAHRVDFGRCMLCQYVQLEMRRKERAVCANDIFVALVPYWAEWPFEVLIAPRRHRSGLDELEPSELAALADILQRMAIRYDNLFEIPFPYSWGFHQRPTDGEPHPEWHMHAHMFPPLLRSATIRKFSVGFEMLASPQRDLTPEEAAERLRAQSERHFSAGQP